jgi:hypothetical protein
MRLRAAVFAAVAAAGSVLPASQAPAPRDPTQAELFQPTKVWTAHLTFTPEQWKAMEPTRGPSGPSNRYSGGEWLQGPAGGRNGWGAVNGVVFHYAHADLEFAGRQFHDVGVRFKGNGTYLDARGSGKLPFKIDLNKYVKGQKIDGVETLNFHNNITDAGWMNEVLSYQLYRDAGVPAPRSSYVRVSVTVTGQSQRRYAGLYTIAENVDDNFLQARFGSGAGALLKPVTVNPFRDLGADWARYVQTYDPKTDLTPADQQRIMDFCRLVTRESDQAFAARVGEFVDLEAFARYLSVLVWIANPDSLLQQGQNYYVHLHPKTRLLAFVPWDQDHSFGQFLWSSLQQQQQLDIFHPWTKPNRLLERLLALPGFRGCGRKNRQVTHLPSRSGR